MMTQNILPLTKTLTPADQADAAGAVRAAYGEKTAVYPIGGGTRLDYGTWPTDPGVGLSLEKLNRLVDYRPDDLTITVEAGMTMTELSKILAQRRQQLHIDVAMPDRSTVGGVAAVNSSGPRRFAHGTMRDFVLGFSAVDGQGTVFSGGGRVLKNAAGYNMGRLMAGSLGTLGVITQLTLRVSPIPETSALTACDPPDLETADKLLADLMQSPIRPAAVELALGPGRKDNPLLAPAPKDGAARLFVGLEGTAVDVQWMLDALRDKWQASGVGSPMTVTSAWAKSLWDWLADFPAQVQIAVRPGALTKMIGAIVSLDPNCTIQAHAGNGILRAVFSPQKKFDFSQLRILAETGGGKLAVLKNPPDSGLICREVWGPESDAFAVMQSLKDRFDPAGILNPGRYIFESVSQKVPSPGTAPAVGSGLW
ncbi:MAG: FAD-binding oxidoreductase [Thermoguttaceae bacterium]